MLGKFILVSLVVVVGALFEQEDYSVQQVDSEELLALVKNKRFVFAKFYVDWCIHCADLAPHFKTASERAGQDSLEVQFLQINLEKNEELAELYNIQSFPTLYLFIEGKPIEYLGTRNADDIYKWVQRKMGDPSLELSIYDYQILKKGLGVSRQKFVIFFGDQGLEEFKNYSRSALYSDGFEFLHTNDPAIVTEEQIQKTPAIKVYRRFDKRVILEDVRFETDYLEEFFESLRYPTILIFDDEASDIIFMNLKTSLFLITSDNQQSSEALETLQSVQDQLKDKILLVISEIEQRETLGDRLAEFLGLTKAQTPSLAIVQFIDEDNVQKYLLPASTPITQQSILEFVNDWENGLLKPHYKSQPRPESQDEAVYQLVGEEFEEFIASGKDSLLMIYAPWCGYCKSLEPEYLKLAKWVQKNGWPIRVAKMDGTANEVQGLLIEQFPTIIFYSAANNAKPLYYNDERNFDKLLQFIEENRDKSLSVSSQSIKSDEL